MRNRPNSSSALESLAESAYADVFKLCTQELPLCLQRVSSSIATRRF